MKSINIIINATLFAALAVLYVLYFTSGKTKETPSDIAETVLKEYTGDIPIAYVNIDSVFSQMKMYTDLQEDLAKKQQSLESSFANSYKTFEQSVSRFQNDVSKGLLTRSEMQEKEQQLNNERIRLENLHNEYLNQIQEQGIVSQRKVIDYVMEYLKEYNKEKGLKYIFSFSFGGNLLYADMEYDITNAVIQGINSRYASEQQGKK